MLTSTFMAEVGLTIFGIRILMRVFAGIALKFVMTTLGLLES